MAMKLYVWEDVLADYTSGVIFAMANSLKEARELVFQAEVKECPRLTRETATIYKEIKDKKPTYVTSKPKSGFCWGGG